MAKTASVSATPSTLAPGQTSTATVTFTNGDTNTVTINGFQPIISASVLGTAANIGNAITGVAPVTVAGAGSTFSRSFQFNTYAPATKGSGLQNSSAAYTLGCIVTFTDNVTGVTSIINASTATVTTNEPTH